MVEGRGSKGSSSSYRRAEERREERRFTRELAMEASRIWRTGSVVVGVKMVVVKWWWWGRRDQWARQMGQVMLPCRMLEAMQVKWKVWAHSPVNVDGQSARAVAEAGVVQQLRGSRQIAHRFCKREQSHK